jgi:hypothetical protein
MERSSILNTQKKAALTLFIVVICFILCWTPYLVYATYGSAIENKELIPGWLNPMVSCSITRESALKRGLQESGIDVESGRR